MEQSKKKQIKKEYVAMLAHYELLQGLALISSIRVRRFLGIVRDEGVEKINTLDGMNLIRGKMFEVASIQPKARMMWDVTREIDSYVFGPMQLFFCVSWAVIDRYRYLANQHPDLVLVELEQYVHINSVSFDAAKKLRDWVLHPGYSRSPDKAMTMFFGNDGTPVNSHPQQIVNRLLALARQLLERLCERTE